MSEEKETRMTYPKINVRYKADRPMLKREMGRFQKRLYDCLVEVGDKGASVIELVNDYGDLYKKPGTNPAEISLLAYTNRTLRILTKNGLLYYEREPTVACPRVRQRRYFIKTPD